MKQIFLVVVLWWFTCGWVGQSYTQSLFYKRYTIDDGLADNVLYGVTQDFRGRIWIGTDNGLSCLTEGQFTNYRMQHGLPSNYITALQENTTDSTLWIATWGGGIVRMKDGRFQRTTFQQQKINRLQLQGNRLIAWKTQLSYWLYIGQNQDTITRETKYNLFKNADHSIQLSPESIAPLMLKESYLLTKSQKVYIFGEVPGLTIYPNADIQERIYQKALKKDTIYAFYEDNYGQKWAALSSHLVSIKRNSLQRVLALQPGVKIQGITSVSPHQTLFWDSKQAFLFHSATQKTFALTRWLDFKSLIAGMYVDKNQNIWVATDGNGLFSIPYPYLQRLTSELNNSFVANIAQGWDNTIYINTKAGYYMLQNGKINHQVSNKHLSNLHISSKGNILYDWANSGFRNDKPLKNKRFSWGKPLNVEGFYISERGLYYHPPENPDTSSILLTSMVIRKLARKSATQKTIAEYISVGDSLNYFIRNGWIDGKKQIWLATSKGVMVVVFKGISQYALGVVDNLSFIPPDQIEQKILTTKDGLPDNDVRDIKGDQHGRIWIATAKGICIYENGKCRQILTNTWLRENIIQSILFDQHNVLWIATKKGLGYWDGKQMGVLQMSHGLTSEEVTCLFLDNQQQLWIGGTQGVARIDLTEKIQPPAPIQVRIQEVTVNTLAVQHLQLKYEDTLRIAFEAIDYAFPQKHVYRVRLDNQEWQETAQMHMVYRDLRSGSHTFQVQVRNALGEWSASQQVVFTVQLPWRWIAFGTIGVLGLMGVVIAAVLYRNRRKREMDKRLAALELQTLQAQLNPHFIFNSLNSIQSFILRHEVKLATQYLSEFATLMRLFLDSSKLRYITIEDELKLLKLYIELEQLRFQDTFAYEIVLDEAVSEDWEIPSMFLQPFVENAINHGLLHKKSPGLLQIEFRCEGNMLICVIDDDGVGRQKAQQIKQQSYKSYQSRAMQIIEEKVSFLSRLEQIEVLFVIDDKYDAEGLPSGTRVTLRMAILN